MPSEARPFPLIVESKSPCVADAIGALERRLNAFYATNISYYNSAAESDKTLFWEPVAALSRSIVAARPRVRILEVGAEKSQLPDYLSRSFSRKQLDFVAHDINDTNKEFYQQRQVPLLVGSLAELKDEEPFDIIVSFFAYEHMPRPAESLDLMQSLLRSDGRLVIICPKYTCPLYIPPRRSTFEPLAATAHQFASRPRVPGDAVDRSTEILRRPRSRRVSCHVSARPRRGAYGVPRRPRGASRARLERRGFAGEISVDQILGS